MVINNNYAKVVVNKAKIYYLKFVAELLFRKINNGFVINNFDIIYIDWYNKAIYKNKRGVFGYKNAVVGLKFLKAKVYKEVINNFILYTK